MKSNVQEAMTPIYRKRLASVLKQLRQEDISCKERQKLLIDKIAFQIALNR